MRPRKLATIDEATTPVASQGGALVGRIRAVNGVDANGLGADPSYDIDVYDDYGVRTLTGIRPASRNNDSSDPPSPALLIKACQPPRLVLVLVDGDQWEFWIPETYAVGPCPETP